MNTFLIHIQKIANNRNILVRFLPNGGYGQQQQQRQQHGSNIGDKLALDELWKEGFALDNMQTFARALEIKRTKAIETNKQSAATTTTPTTFCFLIDSHIRAKWAI